MPTKEILYERNLTGSFMKLTAGEDAGFDSGMLLRKKLPGLLPMEKCYVDHKGEYWYNISGKQSLDTYCQIRSIGMEFVEQIIISICSEIEILDRNLIRPDCLLLDPGQIFVENRNQEIIFAAYPEEQETLAEKFRQLMEYLLTKIDHKDQDAVKMAYGLYEKTLDEGYSVMDVRDFIIKERMASREELDVKEEGDSALKENEIPEASLRPQKPMKFEVAKKAEKTLKREKPSGRENAFRGERTEYDETGNLREPLQELYLHIKEIWENWRASLMEKLPGKAETGTKEQRGARVYPEIVYPEAEVYPAEERQQSYPTICLSDYRSRPEGILLYEGRDDYEDIRLSGEMSTIGKGEGVDADIEKDTISHFHARIHCQGSEYFIEDLNSTNGTYVNENLLCYKEKRLLNSNDIIRFADVKYRFV
jgi:hypothetical protein